jgi:type II secretory pathway component GspD/PulD (secretin)
VKKQCLADYSLMKNLLLETEYRCLKDLPGWFFGLRYLFGSDQTIVNKKELVILLKAEIVPTLKERSENPTAKNLIQEQFDENKRQIKFYELKQSDSQSRY